MLQLNSNLKVLSSQKFKMDGKKFFQTYLDHIKAKIMFPGENEKPMPPSAIAAFIGVIALNNSDVGILDEDFTIAKLSKKLNIPYNTAKDGFNYLLEHSFIKEKLYPNFKKTVYEIVLYASENRTKAERPQQQGNLSYFRIPEHVFKTSVIAELVSKKDNRGLVYLLDLFNWFSREFKNSKENVSDYVAEYNVLDDPSRGRTGLKTRLKRSAKRVREYFELISPLFNVTPETIHTKHANEHKKNRIRKEVDQICIKKFKVTISPFCVCEPTPYSPIYYKMLKECTSRLNNLGYHVNQSLLNGIRKVFYSNVVEVAEWMDESKQIVFVKETMDAALNEFELRHKTFKIDNPGGMLNTLFRKYVTNTFNFDPHLPKHIVIEMRRIGGKCPKVIRDFLKLDENLQPIAS